MAAGAVCSCGLQFNGTTASGTCAISTACTYLGGGGGDPGCAAGQGQGMCGGTNGYPYDGTNFAFNSGATYH
jgi:hypothetical protein